MSSKGEVNILDLNSGKDRHWKPFSDNMKNVQGTFVLLPCQNLLYEFVNHLLKLFVVLKKSFYERKLVLNNKVIVSYHLLDMCIKSE